MYEEFQNTIYICTCRMFISVHFLLIIIILVSGTFNNSLLRKLYDRLSQ